MNGGDHERMKRPEWEIEFEFVRKQTKKIQKEAGEKEYTGDVPYDRGTVAKTERQG